MKMSIPSKADISENFEYKGRAEESNLARKLFFFETFSVEVEFRALLKGGVGGVVAVY